MRILHTADWHLGKKLNTYNRLEEQKQVLKEITDIAEQQAVDIVIVAGDLFDNFTPSNEAMELLYQTLSKLGRKGKVPVIAIAGNHDSPERINVPDVFAKMSGVIFIGYPQAVIQPYEIEGGFKIIKSDEGFFEISLPEYAYPIRVLHTAFANETRLKEYFGEDKRRGLQETLTEKWKELAEKYCDQNGVNILTTHLFMQKRNEAQLEEPEGEKPLNIGTADLVYSDAIPKAIQYAALGHLHGYRDVGTFQPVIYSSSPLCYSFSEAGQKKYVVIADIKPGAKATVERIELHSGKALIRKTFNSVMDAVQWLENNPDTLVELTIQTEGFLTAVAQKQIRQSHDGIIYLIPKLNKADANDSETTAIDLTLNETELFIEYFKSKNGGVAPNEELTELLKEIMNAD